MTQELIQIPLHDGKISYSQLNLTSSDDFVIYLHGLASHTGRTLPFYTAQGLASAGFSVLRLGLYDTRDHARKVIDSTLAVHAQDLHTAIDFVRAHYKSKRIHVVGHSFGGLTILIGKPDVTSAILLDPSHPNVNPFRKAQYVKELDAYLRESAGLDYLIGPAMVNEYNQLTPEAVTSDYKLPTLIIAAGDGPFTGSIQSYEESLQQQTKIQHVIINGADHSFSSVKYMTELLNHSVAWLKQGHTES